jgi:hypothetical protein
MGSQDAETAAVMAGPMGRVYTTTPCCGRRMILAHDTTVAARRCPCGQRFQVAYVGESDKAIWTRLNGETTDGR